MNDQIRQIAERLRGLREALEMNTEEFATRAGVNQTEYERYESGNFDIPMSLLFGVAQTFGIDTTELLAGETARASVFFVTRKGTGISVERRKAYKYQALGAGFTGNKSEVFDSLINKAESAIQLMQERRTALISSAVTGKIDVRHHASRPSGNDKKQTEGI